MENDARQSYLLSLNCGTKFIHNAGANYTNGKQCSDCGRFIAKGTLEYFMTNGILSIWMAIHNRGVAFTRGETKTGLNAELKGLMDKLDNKEGLLKMTEKEAQEFMSKTYDILSHYKILDTEAVKVLNN